MRNGVSRRNFLKQSAGAALLAPGMARAGTKQPTAQATPIPASASIAWTQWQPGFLDIHHIATGRGNSTLAVMPDGTTLLIDAGAIYDQSPYTISPIPDGSRRPGQWIAAYIERILTEIGKSQLDYAFLTHFHADHIGEASPAAPLCDKGYRLTGITDIAERLAITRILDRGYPSYNYPTPADSDDRRNYEAFVAYRKQRGQAVEKIVAGSGSQVRLQHAPESYPDCNVRVLAVNGEVWEGHTEAALPTFPTLSSLLPSNYPSENMCSGALRLTYGDFTYYTGGDLTHDVHFAHQDWRDIESRVAERCGPVTVAVTNHHGYIDSTNPESVRSLAPKAFVVLTWDGPHPTILPLDNMLNRELNANECLVFATALKEENRIITKMTSKLASSYGHIVVRSTGTKKPTQIAVMDPRTRTPSILATFELPR